jgi:hypothetical protein
MAVVVLRLGGNCQPIHKFLWFYRCLLLHFLCKVLAIINHLELLQGGLFRLRTDRMAAAETLLLWDGELISPTDQRISN